jgi:hypothetical protein
VHSQRSQHSAVQLGAAPLHLILWPVVGMIPFITITLSHLYCLRADEIRARQRILQCSTNMPCRAVPTIFQPV